MYERINRRTDLKRSPQQLATATFCPPGESALPVTDSATGAAHTNAGSVGVPQAEPFAVDVVTEDFHVPSRTE